MIEPIHHELSPLEIEELSRLLAEAGAPRIFWPGLFRAVDLMLLARACVRVPAGLQPLTQG